MSRFGWLHLTDLHCGMKAQGWLWPNIENAFFADLEILHRRCGPWDAILFSGDLVQSGTTEEFKRLNEWLTKLYKHLDKLGSKPKLLTVPGNHDLRRPAADSSVVQLLRDWATKQNLWKAFWENDKNEYRKVVKKALQNYEAWSDSNSFPKPQRRRGLLSGDFACTIKSGKLRIAIVGLNTTALQLGTGKYKGRLAIHPTQLTTACGGDPNEWTNKHDACILMTHRPTDWLARHDRELFDQEIYPPGRFAVHLFGHMHEHRIENISKGSSDVRRSWQGASVFGLETWDDNGKPRNRSHGYSAGQIEENGNELTLRMWPRLAVKHQAGHWQVTRDVTATLDDKDEGTRPEVLHRRLASIPPLAAAGAQPALLPQNIGGSDLFQILHLDVVHSLRQLSSNREAMAQDARLAARLAVDVCTACRKAMGNLLELSENGLHCCLKVLLEGSGKDGTKVATLGRSQPFDDRPFDAGAENGHLATKNSVWSSLLGLDDGQFSWRWFSCFCSNDLVKHGSGFRCDRPGWQAYYRAALVFPIRYVTEEHANDFKTLGFLAFDSPHPGVFQNFPDILDFKQRWAEYHDLLKRQPAFHLGALIADTLGMLLYPFYSDTLTTTERRNV